MRNKGKNAKPKNCNSQRVRREQPKKDDKSKRINEDNARVSKVEKDIEEASKDGSANDISWYNNNPELLKSAASFPFSKVLGRPIWTNQKPVPGIMAMMWEPTVAGEDGIPINQAFDSMYSYLVHANSRNYNYSSADLGMLCIAGSQVFACIAAIVRAYGIVKYYAQRNMYFPDTMLRALGFIPQDFREHLGSTWFRINNVIDRTRQIWIPNVMPIFDRWVWLNSMVFTDAPGVQSQSYVYVQSKFLAYDEILSPQGGLLRPVKVPDGSAVFTPGNNQYTIDTWFTVVEFLISQLINSEDRGIIFGDILNAYGSEKIRAMAQIPSDYVTAPVYNAEVLTQIENTVPNRARVSYIAQTTQQYNNKIVECWDVIPNNSPIMGHMSSVVLNFHFPEQPSPEQVMIATRMMSFGFSFGAWYFDEADKVPKYGNYHLRVDALGSELVHDIFIYDEPQNSRFSIWSSIAEESEAVTQFEQWCRCMAFDWHPFFYTMRNPLIVDPDSGNFTGPGRLRDDPMYAYGDYDNYTIIQVDELARIHRVALFSLWGVPHI